VLKAIQAVDIIRQGDLDDTDLSLTLIKLSITHYVFEVLGVMILLRRAIFVRTVVMSRQQFFTHTPSTPKTRKILAHVVHLAERWPERERGRILS
jgi:hypothetical protein